MMLLGFVSALALAYFVGRRLDQWRIDFRARKHRAAVRARVRAYRDEVEW